MNRMMLPLAFVVAGLFVGIVIGVFSLHALADDRPRPTVRTSVAEVAPRALGSAEKNGISPKTDDARDRANVPIEFLTSRGRQCRRRRRRVVCDGPRRIPRPHGPEAELASDLGIALGTRRVARNLLWERPRTKWLAAITPGKPTPSRLRWPVPGGKFLRGFGYVRRRPRVRHRPHFGIDIGAPERTPIRSVADGLVTYSDNRVSGYGNLLMVLHRDGSLAVYAHNRTNFVFAGQQVKAGEVVAEVGHTGLAQGPHLHFELRSRGRPRNPMRRLRAPSRREAASDLYL